MLFGSLFGKRWHRDELFYASWDEVPVGVRDALGAYERALQVGFSIVVRLSHASICPDQ